MWSFSKRLAALCCASLTASAALLSADIVDSSFDNGDNFYGNAFYDGAYSGAYGECCDSHWGLDAQFLYWKAHVDSLPISRIVRERETLTPVTVGDETFDVVASESISYDTRYPHFKWRPGVRLILGYKNPECVWDFSAAWTYLYSNAHGDQRIGCNSEEDVRIQTGWPTGLDLPIEDVAFSSGHARGRWNLNFNVFEFSLGHTYSACDCFTLRPHADLKVAWINQRFTGTLRREFETTISTETIIGSFHEHVSAERRFTGVGPQMGLGLSWDLGCGWNLFADGYAAILYARPKIHVHAVRRVDIANNDVLDAAIGPGQTHQNRNHDRNLFYNTGIGVGFGWNSWLCDNSYLVSLKLAWEQHLYFDQNNFHRGTNIQSSEEKGNLSLYGLTVALGLDF